MRLNHWQPKSFGLVHPITELKAGGVVAIAAFCQALIYGLLAFSPLGAQGVGLGLYAGLASAVMGGLVGTAWGKAPAQFAGPRGSTSLITASTLALLLQTPGLQNPNHPVELQALLILLGLQLGLSGVWLWVAQRQGLGKAMVYIPAPVLIGLNTMVGFFTFYSLIPALLGFAVYVKPLSLISRVSEVSWLALGLSLCIGLTLYYFRQKRPTPLSPLYGLLVGLVLYALANNLGAGNQLGPTAGTVPRWPWDTSVLGLWISGAHSPWQHAVEVLLHQPALIGQITLASAISASIILIESMCAHLLADQQLGSRHNTARELNVLALSNLLAGLLMTLPVSNFSNRTSAGLASGARSRRSDGLHAAVIALVAVALVPWWADLPILVVAALAGISSLLSIQPSTYKLFLRQIIRFWKPELALNASERFTFWVVTIMLTAAGAINLLAGVVVGVLCVAVYFLKQQTTSGLGRVTHNPGVRSRTQRSAADNNALNSAFETFCWVQFEGNVYFANAPQVLMRLQQALKGSRWVLLDFTRLRYVDETGLDNLQRLTALIKRQGCWTLVCAPLNPTETVGYENLRLQWKQHGLPIAESAEEGFWRVENAMLGHDDAKRASADKAEQMDVASVASWIAQQTRFTGLEHEQLTLFAQAWTPRNLSAGETLFKAGAPSDGVFWVFAGQLSAWLDTNQPPERLMRFQTGSLVGEMALLDGNTRSARVSADRPSVVLHLSQSTFEHLGQHCPQAKQALVEHIALSMAHRMRQSNLALSLTAQA